jgi:hypothetical protein
MGFHVMDELALMIFFFQSKVSNMPSSQFFARFHSEKTTIWSFLNISQT